MKRTQKLVQLGVFLVALAFSTNFQVAAAGNGGGKGGGGGGSDSSVASVTFDDAAGQTVQSDGAGPYYHDPKHNVTVSFSQDGHLSLDTNSSNKPGAGRSLYVDFGQPIHVVDGEGNPYDFQTTADLDVLSIEHDVNLDVGAFQDNFNMLTMTEGEIRSDINLWFNLFLHFPGKNNYATVFVKLAPEVLDNGRQCEASDPVRVICTAVDASGNPIEWYVTTEDPDNYACVDTDPWGHTVGDLNIGLRNLSFGFTVTR